MGAITDLVQVSGAQAALDAGQPPPERMRLSGEVAGQRMPAEVNKTGSPGGGISELPVIT